MEKDYIDSFYAKTLASDATYPSLENDITVETCVIGGGLAGLNTALELAQADHSVALIESHKIGWGASGRNGGFVVPSYALGAKELIDQVGEHHTSALYKLLDTALDKITSRIKDYKIECGPSPRGMLKLSLRNNSNLKDYSAFVSHKTGQEIEYWDNNRVMDAISSSFYQDGVLYKSAFQFHPLNYTRGIAEAAAKHGVEIYEHSRAETIHETGALKSIILENGCRITAQNIVYACSGYIGRLSKKLSNAIVPVSTYVMNTEPLGDRMKDIIRVPYCILDTRFANDYYRPLEDTRLLWGGRVSVFNPDAQKLKKMLHHDMIQVFPQLSDVKIENAWGGYMGYSRHKMPQIQKLGDGIWCCTAFGGYGMATTTVGGQVMAEAILGKTENFDLFKPFGLHYTGGPILASAVTQSMYWLYQAIDGIKSITDKA